MMGSRMMLVPALMIRVTMLSMVSPTACRSRWPYICRNIPWQNTTQTPIYSLQSSCNSGSLVMALAMGSEKKTPTTVKRDAVTSIRMIPVVATRQASSGFPLPSFWESRAFRPTLVPTDAATIRNWTAYTSEVAVRAFSLSRATKMPSTMLYSD